MQPQNKTGVTRYGVKTIAPMEIKQVVKNDAQLLSKNPGGALEVGKAIFKKANTQDFLDYLVNEELAKEANLNPNLSTALAIGTTLSVAKDEADKGEDAGSALLKGGLYAMPVVAGVNAMKREFDTHRAPGKGRDYLAELKNQHNEAQGYHTQFKGKEHLLKTHSAEEFAKLPEAHRNEINKFHEDIIKGKMNQGLRGVFSNPQSAVSPEGLAGIVQGAAYHVGKNNPEWKGKSHEEYARHILGDEHVNNVLSTHKNYINEQMQKAPKLEEFHKNLEHLNKAGYTPEHINRAVGLMQIQKKDVLHELTQPQFSQNKSVRSVLKTVAPHSNLQGLDKALGIEPKTSLGNRVSGNISSLWGKLTGNKKTSEPVQLNENNVAPVQGLSARSRDIHEPPTRIIHPSGPNGIIAPGEIHAVGAMGTASKVLKNLRKVANIKSFLDNFEEQLFTSFAQEYFL